MFSLVSLSVKKPEENRCQLVQYISPLKDEQSTNIFISTFAVGPKEYLYLNALRFLRDETWFFV